LGYNINTGFKIKLIDLSDNTVVTSGGGTNTQTLQPPAGKIYQVIQIEYSVATPPGSSANTHDLVIQYQSSTVAIATLSTAFSKSIYISGATTPYEFFADSEDPSAASQQFKICSEAIWCSNSLPVDFIYTNDTDANQTGTRTLIIYVKEYNEMK